MNLKTNTLQGLGFYIFPIVQGPTMRIHSLSLLARGKLELQLGPYGTFSFEVMSSNSLGLRVYGLGSNPES